MNKPGKSILNRDIARKHRNAAFMPQPNGEINVYNICAFDANVAR